MIVEVKGNHEHIEYDEYNDTMIVLDEYQNGYYERKEYTKNGTLIKYENPFIKIEKDYEK